MGYTYENREAVADMVRVTVMGREGVYDTEAITDYLWLKTDVDSGFMDVTVGEFYDIVDTNRLDIPQIRDTVTLVSLIVTTRHASIQTSQYAAYGGAEGIGRKYTAYVGNHRESREVRIDVLSVGRISPIVRLYDVKHDPYDEYDQSTDAELLVTDDATKGLAEFGRLLL